MIMEINCFLSFPQCNIYPYFILEKIASFARTCYDSKTYTKGFYEYIVLFGIPSHVWGLDIKKVGRPCKLSS